MLLALAFAVALAAPFEDVEGRFHLELPAHWEFAPQPGDRGGAAFRRQVDGVYANAMVRIMPLPAGATLTEFAASVRAASENEPGYRSLARKRCTVAGQPAECRRYISLIEGNPHLAKMAEQRIVLLAGQGYVLHAESLADGFAVFEPDVLALLASFAVGPGPRGPSAVHEGASWHDLLGSWQSRGGHRLQLSPAGTVVLDERHGSYQVQAGTLICRLDDGMAVFTLSLRGGQLTLSGGMFGEGESFTRPKRPSQPDRAAPPVPPALPTSIHGG